MRDLTKSADLCATLDFMGLIVLTVDKDCLLLYRELWQTALFVRMLYLLASLREECGFWPGREVARSFG